MLAKIKLLLGIQDTGEDAEILQLIEQESNMICLYINEEALPVKLEFLVIDGVISRYRRRGKEGMKSESIESHKADFEETEKRLDIIRPHLDRWMALNQSESETASFFSFRMSNG